MKSFKDIFEESSKHSTSEWIECLGNKVHRTCVVFENVSVGSGNIFYPFATIGLPGFIRQASASCGRVVIGSGNMIGAHCSIMAGSSGSTEIADNNLIMNYVNIGHNAIIGSDNEIGAGSIIAGWVKIGDLNKIKLSCTFRNRVSVDSENLFGMGSVITKSFCGNKNLIYGVPAKFVRKLE